MGHRPDSPSPDHDCPPQAPDLPPIDVPPGITGDPGNGTSGTSESVRCWEFPLETSAKAKYLAAGDAIVGVRDEKHIALHSADGSFIDFAPRLIAHAIASARTLDYHEVLRGRLVSVGAEVRVELCLVPI